MARPDYDLVVLLRLIGAAELAAVLFVFVPVEWMAFIHDQLLGLGPFPDRPVAVYLARHLSALYAVHGALFLAVSLDPPRYRPLARLLGWCHVVLGAALAWTDWSAGLPWVWAVAEGILVGGCGGLVVWFAGEPRQHNPSGRVPGDGEE